MPRNCDASNYLYDATSYAVVGGALFTSGCVVVDFRPTWDQDDDVKHLIWYGKKGANDQVGIWKWDDNKLYGGWYTASVDHRIILASADYNLKQNEWNRILINYETASADKVTDLWLNGDKIGSVNGTVTFANPMPLYIGSSSVEGADGALANWRSWKRSLSDNEISSIFAGLPIWLPDINLNEFRIYGDDSPEPSSTGGAADTSISLVGSPSKYTGSPPNLMDMYFSYGQIGAVPFIPRMADFTPILMRYMG